MGLARHKAVSSFVTINTMVDRLIPALIALLICGAIIWGRVDPITVVDSRVTPEVHRGGRIEVQRHIEWNRKDCWSYDAATTLYDSLTPSFSHTVELKHYGLPTLSDFTDHDWQVPLVMPWGKAKISTDLAFSCFPFFKLWPVKVELPDLTFEVVPGP